MHIHNKLDHIESSTLITDVKNTSRYRFSHAWLNCNQLKLIAVCHKKLFSLDHRVAQSKINISIAEGAGRQSEQEQKNVMWSCMKKHGIYCIYWYWLLININIKHVQYISIRDWTTESSSWVCDTNTVQFLFTTSECFSSLYRHWSIDQWRTVEGRIKC